MLYIRTGTGKIQSQELSFELCGLNKTEKKDKAFVKVSYNGNFRLLWEFEHENSGKEWDVNYKLNNYEACLRKIELSPVSVWLTIYGEVLDVQEGVAVNMEGGNRIIINNEECNVSYTPLYGGVNTISAEFDRLIIVDDVESIEIGGQKFNVNGE